jgi:hypothetical protein
VKLFFLTSGFYRDNGMSNRKEDLWEGGRMKDNKRQTEKPIFSQNDWGWAFLN